MRLLMVSGDRAAVAGKRGAFWYTLQGFAEHWESVDILCPHVPTVRETVVHGETLGLPHHVRFFPGPRGLWRQPGFIRRQGAQLHAEQPYDVMTVQEYPPFYNGIGAALLHRAIGIPYALEMHHVVGFPVSADWSERVGYWLARAFFRFDAKSAAAVRVVNSGVQWQLSQWGIPQKKLHIVPSFYLDQVALGAVPSPETAYDVVACGRLVANKAFDELLRAMALLEGASLFLIGDGPERTHLERVAKQLGLADRVMFAGWLPDQHAVYQAIASAKVFVMCSKSEGGPRVLLEAMALGKPVVTTAVGVAPDVIEDGETGFLTDGTAKDMAREIQRLLDDAALRKRAGSRAQTVTQRFERSHALQQYAAFLQSLALQKR